MIALCTTALWYYHSVSGLTSSYSRGPGPDTPLALDHALLNPNPGDIVEQVHVTGGYPDAAIVTWSTKTSASPSVVTVTTSAKESQAVSKTFSGTRRVISQMLDPSGYYPHPGPNCMGSHNYTNPDCVYTSGVIHSVELTDLKPSTAYTYSIDGVDKTGTHTYNFSFTTPPAVGPSVPTWFGVVGDLGQTSNSSNTVTGLSAGVSSGQYQLILHAGDLSYADGFGPRWDSYARMGQSLWSSVATAHVGGNHEIANGGESWLQYENRYPNPHSRSGSASFLWYSFDVGSVHVVTLCSYAAYGADSLQYQWLENDLAKVDRSRTPWVVAMWHTPWYTSNAHHPMREGAAMKSSMESLLYKSGVNIVLNGHVHAYERTEPVYMEKVTPNGITHITIGDGGNREMFATPWVDPQPEWSALREDAYGHGSLQVVNSTHAHWTWLRNKDPWNPNPERVVGDDVWITRA